MARHAIDADAAAVKARDHAVEATHHHHKYLPNRPRQSRQEQAPRRPTRPRPRASPTRRRLHQTPR